VELLSEIAIPIEDIDELLVICKLMKDFPIDLE
jgi:hypothetical protein